MRIVGGRHRGRKLAAPRGTDVRPTSDRARESLFNVLAHGLDVEWDGLSVLDVFAGTGALGLEALSRGAAHATFIDRDRGVLHGIRRNGAALGEWRNIALLAIDATRLPPPPRAAATPCGLAFLDPPYESGLGVPALQGLVSKGWLADGAVCTVEVAAREVLDPPKGFSPIDARTYGAARIVFLRFGGAQDPTNETGPRERKPATR